MKKIVKTLFIALFIAVPLFLMSQSPPHPNGGSSPTGGNTPVGGGAPLSGGLIILISLAIGYGVRRVYQFREQNKE